MLFHILAKVQYVFNSNYGLLILYMVCHLDFIEDFD